MNPQVVIRRCRKEDLRTLEWDGLFTHHREIFEQTFDAQSAGDQLMLVAEVDGAPLGQGWIDLRQGRERRAGVIWAFRVHPGMHRRSIGTRLLLAAEEIIRAHGLCAAELYVEPTNLAARTFYEHHGYTAIRNVTQTYSYSTPDGDHREHCSELVEMRKELPGQCGNHRSSAGPSET
jgi:ribosomal protein S18 acetylase RimI-like enzyme